MRFHRPKSHGGQCYEWVNDMSNLKIVYFSSTHWDREWYVPFQDFRMSLVDTVDELTEILKSNPDYKVFCLDGQTIVLEDYKEIAGERVKELQKLIDDGRVRVGPKPLKKSSEM